MKEPGGETEEVEAGSRYQADRNESERQPNPVKAAQGSGHGFEVQGTAYHMGYKEPMDDRRERANIPKRSYLSSGKTGPEEPSGEGN